MRSCSFQSALVLVVVASMLSHQFVRVAEAIPRRTDFDSHEEDADSDEDPFKSVGPVFTFVKTDPHANIKWGVRHYVGKKYA